MKDSQPQKAVIYARYSSDKQTEQSIEVQLQECYKYAKANNLIVITEYIDRALSGRNDDRAEFQQMINDSKNKMFQFVLVFQFDRFARNRYDSAINKNILKKNGVKVISIKEPISNDPAGILLESVLEGFAEYFSADLAQKIVANQKMNKSEGNFTGGYFPFGYKIVDKKYKIDPIKAKTVKDVFKMYTTGSTINEILLDLKKQGVKNNLGNYFSKSGINRMLSNKTYLGILNNFGLEQKNKIPAIIDETIFKKAEQRMEANKKIRGSKKANEKYILSGKLHCGYCESLMFGESGTSKTGKVYNYYKCHSKKQKSNNCHKKTIKKDDLEKFVVKATQEFILQDNVLKNIAHDVYVLNLKESKSDLNLKRLTKQSNETEKSIKNILNAIEQGIITPTTKERLLQLEEEKNIINVQMQIEKFSKNELTEAKIQYFFEQFKNGKIDDKKFQERIIDVFINKIFLFDDKIYIVFNINNNKKFELSLADLENQLSEKVRIVPDWWLTRTNIRTFLYITRDYFVLEVPISN